MADKSLIEWTNTTWNVVTGCNKVSPGCKNCYAERLSKRLKAMGLKKQLQSRKTLAKILKFPHVPLPKNAARYAQRTYQNARNIAAETLTHPCALQWVK